MTHWHASASVCSILMPNSPFLERILGSLISSHILLTDPKHPFGKVGFEGYDNELLHLAHDLAVRLLPAFENTHTGIPHPRVSSTLCTVK